MNVPSTHELLPHVSTFHTWLSPPHVSNFQMWVSWNMWVPHVGFRYDSCVKCVRFPYRLPHDSHVRKNVWEPCWKHVEKHVWKTCVKNMWDNVYEKCLKNCVRKSFTKNMCKKNMWRNMWRGNLHVNCAGTIQMWREQFMCGTYSCTEGIFMCGMYTDKSLELNCHSLIFSKGSHFYTFYQMHKCIRNKKKIFIYMHTSKSWDKNMLA